MLKVQMLKPFTELKCQKEHRIKGLTQLQLTVKE